MRIKYHGFNAVCGCEHYHPKQILVIEIGCFAVSLWRSWEISYTSSKWSTRLNVGPFEFSWEPNHV